MSMQASVLQRYSEGAEETQEELCCPVDYDASLLALLPKEIIDKDYGCGDPSRYVQEGDVVLDLGSGGGKICYMAAQLVGDTGAVIGIDMNDDMLALAGKYQAEMAEKLGTDRVSFVKGYIQDLALNLSATEAYLNKHTVNDVDSLRQLQLFQAAQRQNAPQIEDESIDLVVSNCVLNLVDEHEKEQMIDEIFRVLKPGGRIAISDIIADSDIPEDLKQDDDLWSGCISGAFHEEDFMQAFVDAGFQAVNYDKWDAQPWKTIDGIVFRSATITAVKPYGDTVTDEAHVLMYRGPFEQVADDDAQVYVRGERIEVSAEQYALLMHESYQGAFIDVGEDAQAMTASCCSDTQCCS